MASGSGGRIHLTLRVRRLIWSQPGQIRAIGWDTSPLSKSVNLKTGAGWFRRLVKRITKYGTYFHTRLYTII